MSATSSPYPSAPMRKRWMSVLARTPGLALEEMCGRLGPLPAYEWLRKPESGLVMVRARAGGTGAKFNVGEMSVTRCALRTAAGTTGIAYVQGRNARHAELAAIVDALMQDEGRRDEVEAAVIAPLERALNARHALAAGKAAHTRVDFYTVARAEAP